MKFSLVSNFKPTGDQPKAIEKLTDGVVKPRPSQVLLGVTGSGKTFTIANVIANTQKPTLVVSHNKTLAAQLYQEFRDFFPQNAVSYFVSYYDYYQPEAYVPQTDTYISKEAQINEEIDKLRLKATSNILSHDDVIVVASVSCIYNIGSPEAYQNRVAAFKIGQKISQQEIIKQLVGLYYQRSKMELKRGFFRTRGQAVELIPAYADHIIRIELENEAINKISQRSVFGEKQEVLDDYFLYPAKHYLADEEVIKPAFAQIREDLKKQLKKLNDLGKNLEAQRLEQRVNYDMEMIDELGYVNGIENYSRYFDGRQPGDPPFTLIDYFKHRFGENFLVVVDESHMTVPQIRGMYRGDLARKQTLIDFGFRLPSCLDNRPLRAQEFWARVPQTIFVSATPSDWEIKKSANQVIEQLIRPTGLVDPKVEVKPASSQVKNLISEIKKVVSKDQRVLVTTLTKRTAEELSDYLSNPKHTGKLIRVGYLHSDIDTLERSEILTNLRKGEFEVLVGINLLREGLDLPEVGLVAILDADQQGFLRSKTSLIQTMGRTARNSAGKVILYADKTSQAMKEAIDEVERRRKIQIEYNKKHNITPRSIQKPIRERLVEKKEAQEVDVKGLTPGEAKKRVKSLKRQMRQLARDLEFEQAALVRDQIENLKSHFSIKETT